MILAEERTLSQLEGPQRSLGLPEAGRMKATLGFGIRISVVHRLLNHIFSL